MSRLSTTLNLISDVRSLLDEENNDSVDNAVDILPSLSRAQNVGYDLLSRYFADPVMEYKDMVVTSKEMEMPENMYADKIVHIDVQNSESGTESYTPVKYLSKHEVWKYDGSTGGFPQYYTVVGRNLFFIPTPTAGKTVRLWYSREPNKFVIPYGRITSIGSNYFSLDAVDDSFTTNQDELGSYFNVVDGQTGVLKATFQAKTLSNNRVLIKETPDRNVVLNRDIASSIDSDLEIEEDDYICHVEGTCVPYFYFPLYNFIVQYAVAELKRKLGAPYDVDQQLVKDFEGSIKKSFSGRQQRFRINRVSNRWRRGGSRWRHGRS